MKKLILLLVAVVALTLSACSNSAVAPELTTNSDTDISETPAVIDTADENASTSYNMDEVAKHNNKDDCWSVIDGKIYKLTDWVGKHPGGAGNIVKICGIDGSSAFNVQHGDNDQPKAVLPEYFLANLE